MSDNLAPILFGKDIDSIAYNRLPNEYTFICGY